MKPYFFLENFSFAFDRKASAFFDNISLTLSKPGLTFVVGKNGAGKSTFFRLLQGIAEQNEVTSGFLVVQGHHYDLSQPADRKLLYQRSIILHQSFDSMLAPHFTGLENISFAHLPHYPGLSMISVNQKIPAQAEHFNIPLDKPVHVLSGGQRQMLAMLMVIQRPLDILLLDEPTTALDVKNSNYLMENISVLARENNITILCVSHDNEIINSYADNIVEITETANGKRIIEGK